MSKEIVFQRGEFQSFRASTKFHLGSIQRDVEEGEEILFDGTTVKFQDGDEHSLPKIRGVLKAGWLVQSGEEAAPYRPKPAGIQVRPADDLKARQEGNTNKFSMDTVGHEETVVTSGIGTNSGAQIGNQGRVESASHNQREASVVSGGTLGAQGGKVISGIGSASGAAVGSEGTAVGAPGMEVTASNIGRLRSEQKQREEAFGSREIKSSTPEGVDVVDVLEKTDPDAAARLRERRAAAKASEAKVGGHPNDKADSPAAQGEDGDEDELQALWETGVEPSKDSEKTKLKAKGASEAEKKAAEGFTWDTTVHWTKRVKAAVEYANQPRIIRKILAAETPNVAQKIEAKLDEMDV